MDQFMDRIVLIRFLRSPHRQSHLTLETISQPQGTPKIQKFLSEQFFVLPNLLNYLRFQYLPSRIFLRHKRMHSHRRSMRPDRHG